MQYSAKISVIVTSIVMAGSLVAAQSTLAGMIADAKLAGPGVEVTVENVVISSTTDLISSTFHKVIYIQDSTGGMAVFGDNANIDSILAQAGEGDAITLTATTESWNGEFEFQIQDYPFSFVDHGYVGIPPAASITPADLQDYSATAEDFECTLATVSGVTFVDAGGVFEGETDYEITDGVFTGEIRVSTFEQDLVGTVIPSGVVDITGIIGQWDLTNPLPGTPGVGYCLRVRSLADIVPEPATLSLLLFGGIVALKRRR